MLHTIIHALTIIALQISSIIGLKTPIIITLIVSFLPAYKVSP